MVFYHKFVSPKADGADQSQVRPSNWNDTHIINTPTSGLLGTVTGGTSAEIQVITLGSGLQFSGGTLISTASGSGGGVSTSGSVSAGQIPVFTNTSTLSGFTGTGVLYAASGILTTTSIASGGVSTSGSVTAGQMAVFTNSSTLSGLAATGVLYAASGVVTTTTVGNVTASGTMTDTYLILGASSKTIVASDVYYNQGTGYFNGGFVGFNGSLDIVGSLTVPTVLTDGIYSPILHPKTNAAAATLKLQAQDVDGGVDVDFITLTNNNTPTCDLASSVTQASSKIWNASAAIPYTGIQTVTASTLLGNPNTSVSTAQAITLGTGLAFSGTTVVGSASGLTKTEWFHPNVFLTAGYTTSPATGQATPDAAGSTPSMRRVQFQKDATNTVFSGVSWLPPTAWNASTSLTVTLYGFKTTAGTGTKMQMKVRAGAFSNNDTFSTAWTATAANINFTVSSASTNTMFTASGVVTIDNTPAKGDLVFIQVARDSTTANSGSDDYDNTFGIAGMMISFGINSIDGT